MEAIRLRTALAFFTAALFAAISCCAIAPQAYALDEGSTQQGGVASSLAADHESAQDLERAKSDSLNADNATIGDNNDASNQNDSDVTKDPVAESAPVDPTSAADSQAAEQQGYEDQQNQDPFEGTVDAQAGSGAAHVNMFRLYNPFTSEHFYTSNEQEALNVAAAGWQWEGIGWVAPITSADPVYRLYNPYVGDHHYTLSVQERDMLLKEGWLDEGIGWYSDGQDQVPILRQYNPYAMTGSHNFTASKDEEDFLVRMGWKAEGTAWFATRGVTVPFAGAWLVTSAWGSLERYWINSMGSIVRSCYIDANVENSGWSAYAKRDGAVVRGKWDNGTGYVYVADDKGELAKTQDGQTGWLVTDAYDGSEQRYYYDSAMHAMKSGFFQIDGNRYFGIGGEGYVVRGKLPWGNYVLIADTMGVLVNLTDSDQSAPDGGGWLVTGLYDAGNLQRYWITKVWYDYAGAQAGLFVVKNDQYFGLYDEGYVARNRLKDSGYAVCWANNDGVLSYYCRRCCSDATINERVAQALRDHIGLGGDTLRRAFDWVASFTYIYGSVDPMGDWAPAFAYEMLNNGGGNCYRFAALFCCLARALGYSSGVVAGYVNGAAGGLLPHGWTEIYTSTGTRVCDPDLQHEIPSRDWYWRTYSDSPTVYYF